MPTVHNLHQPLFGYRPCTASHSLRRHDQRTDRLDSDLLLVPLASDSLIEVSLDLLAPRLVNAYTIGARRAQLVHASRPLNEFTNANYYYVISNSSSSFKNQKLDLCSPSGSTSASNPEASFIFHSLSHKPLSPQAVPHVCSRVRLPILIFPVVQLSSQQCSRAFQVQSLWRLWWAHHFQVMSLLGM